MKDLNHMVDIWEVEVSIHLVTVYMVNHLP